MNEQWIQFANEIKKLYGENVVPLHEPTFDLKEKEYVTSCIENGWVSSAGEFVNKFEEELAKFIGVKRAVAVVNGTAALHIALKIAGIKAEDEVLVPSLTFIATANAVVYNRAIPHFVDVSYETLGIDPKKLNDYLEQIGEFRNGEFYNKQTNRRISAVLPMHTFGHPVDIDGLLEVCEKFNLVMIEDAAESLGSYYKGRHTGTFGKLGAFSFNGNKIITTGGGGAIVTNDEALADYAKHLTTTAKIPHRWEYDHDEVGYNYRMPNINAALGCAQLEKLLDFIAKKRALTTKYEQLIKKLPGVQLFKESPFVKSNYWLQTLILDKRYNRDDILKFLNDQGIMSRPIWKPMHLLKMYKENPRDNLDVTEDLNNRIINIPSTPLIEV